MPSPNLDEFRLDDSATENLLHWAAQVIEPAETPFAAARSLVRRLGGHVRDGQAVFGFWVPELVMTVAPDQVFLEVWRPIEPITWAATEQVVTFAHRRQPLRLEGEFAWGVYDGLRAGRRDQVGDFYHLSYQDEAGQWQTLLDPLAYSVPFGGKAPAELYDLAAMHAARPDKEHFHNLDVSPDPDGVPRIKGPANILQIHVNTATAARTLAGLTEQYQAIAAKIEADESLTPAERNYIGYDAVQLMPIEPIIEYEAGPSFWEVAAGDDDTGLFDVRLRQPDMTNWGYDVLTVASPAPNPCVLGSKRPDELVDFIATLHTFPTGPIQVLFDVVYGHTDNQTLPYLNEHYFAGANMYGQNLRYRQPVVRALLLEMQRRKSDFGVDGLRVDGAQDFKWWDPETGTLHHDDDYLNLMNDVEQEVAGVRYRPWMIFEDGRPWPRADWELASSYREVTRLFPNVVQWGPLTFAHNTPFLFTFWISKYWRIREIMDVGSHWITGCANHDTLRRGTQVDPEARINTYLGGTLPEIFQKAYDNPAAKLFDYVMSPGIPMDFINATMRGPWSFIRNTDDQWAVKVMSEEAYFLDWVVNEARFNADFAFSRLKEFGFNQLPELRRFLRAVDNAVKMTGHDLAVMAAVLNRMTPGLAGPDFTPAVLKEIARAWMDDVHDFCNVAHWQAAVPAAQAAFNLRLRRFRRQRPYLRQNLGAGEFFDYLYPTEGSVIFYGMRRDPAGGEPLFFLANMEGAPRTVTPADLPLPGLDLAPDGWAPVLVTPGLDADSFSDPLTLSDSQGVVFGHAGG